jgi:hypothetical protein
MSTIMTDRNRHERPPVTALRGAVEGDGGAPRGTVTDAERAVEHPGTDV